MTTRRRIMGEDDPGLEEVMLCCNGRQQRRVSRPRLPDRDDQECWITL